MRFDWRCCSVRPRCVHEVMRQAAEKCVCAQNTAVGESSGAVSQSTLSDAQARPGAASASLFCVDAESNGQAKRRRCGSAMHATEIVELSLRLRRVAEEWAGNERGVFIYRDQVFVLPTADKTHHLSADELRVQIARFETATEQDSRS